MHDAETNMIAFYLVRGHKLEDLLNMSYLEKRFLYHARIAYYEEEKAKYKALGGGI